MGNTGGGSNLSLSALNDAIKEGLKNRKVDFMALRGKDVNFYKKSNDVLIYTLLKQGLKDNYTYELATYLVAVSESSPDLDMLKKFIFGAGKLVSLLGGSSDKYEKEIQQAYGQDAHTSGINISDSVVESLKKASTLTKIEELLFSQQIVRIGFGQAWHSIASSIVYKKKSAARKFYNIVEQLL